MPKEQLSFDFDDPEKEPLKANSEPPVRFEQDFAERDECPACGNAFESTSSCPTCMGNKAKIKYLRNLAQEKNKKTQ